MPVSAEVLLAFMAAATVLLVIPGPTIVMVVSQALAHGRSMAAASVLGVALGDLLAATLSIIGVGTLLATSASLFTLVKWLGAAYLIYIGIKMWRSPITVPVFSGDEAMAMAPSIGTQRQQRFILFRDAFIVTALNPKGILFFMAFVPQFIDASAPFAQQASFFVIVFVTLGAINAYGYIWLAASARQVFRKPAILRRATRSGAVLLIAAGLASALTQRA